MILFQVVALLAVALALLRELLLVRRGLVRGVALAARLGLLLATAAAIAWPESTQIVAEWLGIGRGADVVLYLAVLAGVFLSLYFYGRIVRQQRRLTALVRHLAILDARRGGTEGDAGVP